MIRPMHFRTPTDEEIHMAFAQGERAIRALFHDVATQMAEGAQQCGRIRGYLSTARKHAKNAFEVIRDAFEGQPFIPSLDMQ